MNRKAIERAIYTATHKDYRGARVPGSTGSILQLSPSQGTVIVSLSEMTDAELLDAARRKRVDLTLPRFGMGVYERKAKA